MKRYTRTSTFIFPLLQIPKSLFSCKIRNGFGKVVLDNRFIDAYLSDEKIEKYSYENNHVFIHVNNFQDLSFNSFYDTLTGFPNYVEDYERNNNLIFIFKVEERFQNDLKLLLQIGAGYSQISKEAKSLILKNYFSHINASTIPLILSKGIFLKNQWNEKLNWDIGDQEVWPMIQTSNEVLTTEILKNYNYTAIKPREELL